MKKIYLENSFFVFRNFAVLIFCAPVLCRCPDDVTSQNVVSSGGRHGRRMTWQSPEDIAAGVRDNTWRARFPEYLHRREGIVRRNIPLEPG